MTSCQKVPKFDYKVNFLSQKSSETFSFFFHWRVPIQDNIFCYWHFLIKSIFKSLYLLKWCPIFDSFPLILNSKFNNFLWGSWFLCKNLSKFVPPTWKLYDPYCHNWRFKWKIRGHWYNVTWRMEKYVSLVNF